MYRAWLSGTSNLLTTLVNLWTCLCDLRSLSVPTAVEGAVHSEVADGLSWGQAQSGLPSISMPAVAGLQPSTGRLVTSEAPNQLALAVIQAEEIERMK